MHQKHWCIFNRFHNVGLRYIITLSPPLDIRECNEQSQEVSYYMLPVRYNDPVSRRTRSRSLPASLLKYAISGGSRILGSVPGLRDAATITAGSLAERMANKRKPSRSLPPRQRHKALRLANTPGKTFNPGGSGGYVAKKVNVKPKKKIAAKLSPSMKLAISKLVNLKSRDWTNLQNLKYTQCLQVRTTSDFPCVPGTSAVVNDNVGWYCHGMLTRSQLHALVDNAYRRDAYTTSGTAEIRKVPQTSAAAGGSEQQEFRVSQTFTFLLRNNSSAPLLLEVFAVKATEQCVQTPLEELNLRFKDANVVDTGVIVGTDPQSITKNFRQGWFTPNMKNSSFNVWKKCGSSYSISLNPGDEGNVAFSHAFTYLQDVADDTNYYKGAYGVIFRVMGSLSHSDVSPSLVHRSLAQVDMESYETTSIKMRDALFVGQRRIKNNATVTAFTDDVTAGDAVQHDAAL